MSERPLRALVVDDERLARVRLRRLLSAYPENVHVVSEADSVDAAAAALEGAIAAGRPIEVVFLDVQMPGRSGFALFDATEVACPVVFVTAFSAHAVRAFEVNALDYLVKPVSRSRLERCLARLGAEESSTATLEAGDRVHIVSDGVQRFVRREEILGVRAEGDYTAVLLADGGAPWTRQSLGEWEQRLGCEDYLRIHRGAIARLDAVEELRKEKGGGRLRLGAHELPVSRRCMPVLKQRLSKR